eukprot:5576302-Pleurochrysis_carterae.AAC.1
MLRAALPVCTIVQQAVCRATRTCETIATAARLLGVSFPACPFDPPTCDQLLLPWLVQALPHLVDVEMFARLLSGSDTAGALDEAAALLLWFRPAQSNNAASQNTSLKISTAWNKALHAAETMSETIKFKILFAVEPFSRAW